MREKYGTPEELVAFFAIKDIPLGTAQVTDWVDLDSPAPSMVAWLQLAGSDGKTKDLRLSFTEHEGRWKLVVPQGVGTRYLRALKDGPMTTP